MCSVVRHDDVVGGTQPIVGDRGDADDDTGAKIDPRPEQNSIIDAKLAVGKLNLVSGGEGYEGKATGNPERDEGERESEIEERKGGGGRLGGRVGNGGQVGKPCTARQRQYMYAVCCLQNAGMHEKGTQTDISRLKLGFAN
ncbi:hypothetical protein ACFX12_013870 [Malus domestica]